MIIEFTIPFDPVPYLRMTQGEVKLMRIPRARIGRAFLSKWDRIHQYLQYKKQLALIGKKYLTNFDLSKKMQMVCIFYFRSGRHGDPDNCWKAIADALFHDDNRLVGCFDFFIDKENPQTEVTIVQD